MVEFYEKNPDPDNFYQGDILKDYDVVILPEKNISVDNVNQLFTPATSMFHEGTAFVPVKKIRTNIMIISHTCDILRRDFVAVCPVFSITKIELENKRQEIRAGKVNYRFWLPKQEGIIEESYADLQIINTVKASNLDFPSRVICLTDRYRANLADTLHKYFCRPITMRPE